VTSPSASDQQAYWNDWVSRSHAWEQNPDNARRAACVLKELNAAKAPPLELLDVGCGSGWLALALSAHGRTTAVDLASDAMEELRRAHPSVRWVAGDFVGVELPEGAFDFVASLETIAHVPDQKAFAERIALLTRPGGRLVLTTQNEYVWVRTSWLEPPGAGQIRNWPSRDRLRELFSPRFTIDSISTCAPGGDRGLLRLLNSGAAARLIVPILGRERWTEVRERWGLGRSLVLKATRKA